MISRYYTDYPTEPISDDNPYWRCVYCKVSMPEINGRLDRHGDWCAYRIIKEMEGCKDEDDNS